MFQIFSDNEDQKIESLDNFNIFMNFINGYYKNIETSLNKVWENDNTIYFINDSQKK